jgi:hypothetical protein
MVGHFVERQHFDSGGQDCIGRHETESPRMNEEARGGSLVQRQERRHLLCPVKPSPTFIVSYACELHLQGLYGDFAALLTTNSIAPRWIAAVAVSAQFAKAVQI